jgi:AraC-like DNA-binding protein
MLMGRTSFYKEVKRLTGLTPNEYILEARLTRARHLMETRSDLTLKKVVQLVGLKDEGNFSRAFKKRFGQPPSLYL